MSSLGKPRDAERRSSGRFFYLMIDLWENQSVNMHTGVHHCIKNILKDQFIQRWNQQLSNSSKGLNYSLYKTEFSFEEYLNILPRNKYLPLIKYRTANHYLPIETLRWQSIDVSERKCRLCNAHDIGDEFHYLFVCENFKDVRHQYINTYYFKHPNILKYKELLSSKSPLKLSKLSKFVAIIMSQFKR